MNGPSCPGESRGGEVFFSDQEGGKPIPPV
jgi:hypothetical protein